MNSIANRRTPHRVFAVVAAMALAAWMSAPAAAAAQDEMAKRREVDVQFALQRLPSLGVFDLLTFSVDRGTVTLLGYAYSTKLPAEAADAVKQVRGVDDVVNRIELLPLSPDDDRIRWATYRSIYQDDFLVRYTPSGPAGAAYGLSLMARFPGMQPLGTHAIHIVVKNRRVMLYGAVTSAADRNIVNQRARAVGGVMQVDNYLEVR